MAKILAIDDKKDNLVAFSAVLQNLIPDCSVITSQTGAEGIERAKVEQPDTILLDIKMPGMDGFEVCQRLKSDEKTKHIPIVILTAIDTDTESRVMGLDLGADAFLTKPIDEIEMAAQVNVMLRIKKAEDALREEKDLLENLVLEKTEALMGAKDRLEFSHLLLQIANRNIAVKPVLKEFIAEIKNFTKCEATGIRILDEEGNIPYKAYEGFSKWFYESESPLSIKSDQCICINVVKDDTDPKLPFYTEYGSFYMNGTTRFLATVSEEDKGQTRNVCNQVGYESVALIPIKVGDLILGLIHIADPHENMVPIEMVKVMEEAAMHLGPAVQRISAEEQIKASLKEKEVLLSEIHHRVKNNMQVIISLLKLQADKIEDKKYANMLQESQNRILSMTLVHEQLYMSKDFANIDFGEYVKNFANTLFVSYGVDTNKVKLNIEIIDVSFDLENAIPCGLIINELVSNSLKHAFPQQREGNINIVLQSTNEGDLELTVSDDGVGVPEDLDIEQTDTMGLQLVRILAKQTLEGKMELNIKEGTQFHFILKRSKYKPRI